VTTSTTSATRLNRNRNAKTPTRAKLGYEDLTPATDPNSSRVKRRPQ
jgi:hypothetical protein